MFGKKKKNITVIDLNGVISSRHGVSNKYKHGEMLDDLSDILEDDSTVGVIIRVNSPGGSAGSSYELYDLIKKIAGKKIVYATVTDVACSGAYLAIAPCQKIFCTPMSTVGSIGVLMELPNLKDISEKIGFKMNTFKSGAMKDIGNPFRDMTSEEEKYIQDILKRDHDVFVEIVTKCRPKIDKALCDGRFFTGADAKALGFSDVIGTFTDALDHMKKITEVEEVEYVEHDAGFIQKLINKLNLDISINLDSKFLGRYL